MDYFKKKKKGKLKIGKKVKSLSGNTKTNQSFSIIVWQVEQCSRHSRVGISKIKNILNYY